MKKTKLTFVIPLLSLLVASCSTVPLGGPEPGKGSGSSSKFERMDAVANMGAGKAVLSLHTRREFKDACTYGVTLTNNLPDMIENISFRFSAHINGGVLYKQVTRNFFRLRPTNHQFREITFTGVSCNQIEYLKVSDPGRCSIGKSMTRFTTGPGDCIRKVTIAPTKFVRIVQ